MNTFYALTIYPLELAYKHIYIAFSAYTGSYGMALLCLSLLSTIIFFPLKRIVSGIQEVERKTQAAMAPQLQAIKAESKGGEAQARINGLYKRYSYHPLKALRSSAGVFLQLPFLCAAYYMLSSFEAVRGVTFGPIADLGQPDSLFWGFNALPLLMTIFNLSALFLTRGFSVKDKRQGVMVAFLFLVLLYGAPSALLIYWTTNNFFSLLETLGKNLYADAFDKIKARFIKLQPALPASSLNAIKQKPSLKGFLRFFLKASPVFFVLPFSSLIYAFSQYFYKKAGESSGQIFLYLPLLTAVFIVLGLALFIFPYASRNNYSPKRRLLLAISFLLVLLGLACLSYELSIHAASEQYGQYLLKQQYYINLSLIILALLSADYRKVFSRLLPFFAVPEEGKVFFLSALMLVLTVLFLTPFLLYQAEPLVFASSYKAMSLKLVPYGLMTILLLFVARLLLPEKLRPLSSFFLLTAFLLIFLNSTVFTGNYGVFDSMTLSRPESLNTIDLYLKDFSLLFLVFAISMALYFFRKTGTATRLLQSSVLVIIIGLFLAAFTIKPLSGSAKQSESFIEDAFSFSRSEPNIIVFVLDMFTGGHVENIFEETPELKDKFQGFTWYPDTLAYSHMTSGSMPSLVGGPNYDYESMNERPELTLLEKFTEALSVMPRNFSKAGYQIHLIGKMYSDIDQDFFNSKVGNSGTVFVEEIPEEQILPLWADKIGMSRAELEAGHDPEESAMYIVSLSLFRAVPHHSKKDVYNNGLWLDFSPESSPRWFNETLYNSAFLGLLPNLSSVQEGKASFKMIYSLLPHYSWYLPKEGFIPVRDPYPATKGQLVKVDGLLPEHLYTETSTFRLLADFFDWLKEQGIYENTKIILVSDHCEADSSMLNEALGFNEKGLITPWEENKGYTGRPHALLMVKELGAAKGFKVSKELMSTEDVPALACKDIGGCPEAIYPDTGQTRVRSHYYGFEWRQIEIPGRKQYEKAVKSLVRGTMFKKENWENDLEP